MHARRRLDQSDIDHTGLVTNISLELNGCHGWLSSVPLQQTEAAGAASGRDQSLAIQTFPVARD